MLTDKDKEVYERLLRDLKTVHKINKKQLLEQYDFMYCRWFSQENVKSIRADFSREIDKEKENRGL